ncbi:hypothetical protein ONZ45_g16451 [Pleurotus djamor]|nr:hypothetical protein ONZ45_g16451 [Pleurotus djamor]
MKLLIPHVKNAYYQCNPPERPPRQEKERTPMEMFIRHLIYDVLAKKTIDKVLKLIRKLDWDDPTVARCLHKVFTKPWKLKFGNINLLAMLTYDLQRYHPEFAVSVVDQVLEDIRLGLEQNIYKINQRRVATIRYLGELYIFRILSSGIIFDTLWSLTTFGHPEGRPLPRQPCSLDMPDDFFRIRLVCVLLDTCGMCFERGSQKKKLDSFLTFFQYYILCKEDLPMDIEFMLTDSIEAVRPKLQLERRLEQAAILVDEMFAAVLQNAGFASGDESGEGSGDEDDEARPEEDEEDGEESDAADSPSDERPPSPEEPVVLSASNSLQENLGPSEEAEAEFAKELAKLVTDTSAESRRVDKKTALAMWDSAVIPPAARKKRPEDVGGGATTTDGHDTMNFTLITKRGAKQQTRQIAVPSESALAVHTRSAQLQDKVEQQQLKQLVLDYEQREEAEEFRVKTTDVLEMRSKRINQYRKGVKIGSGKFGEVYCCVNENTNEVVAMKIVKLHFHGIIHRDIKPANLMWTADRSTVKIIDFGVSQFVPSERVAPCPSGNHRYDSFKPLYDPLLFPPSDLTRRMGTPSFLAPELVWSFDNDKEPSGTSSDTLTSLASEKAPRPLRPPITKAIDIWSLAVTFYCLLFGHTPFSVPSSPNQNAHHNEFVMYNMICSQDWDVDETMGAECIPTGGRHPKDPQHEGFAVIKLLDQMLQKDPRRRLSLDQIKKHPWLLRDIVKPKHWLRDTAPLRAPPRPLSLEWFKTLF